MPQIEEEQRDDRRRGGSGGFLGRFSAAELTAYAAAGISAFVAAWLNINDKFTETLKDLPAFKKLREWRAGEQTKLTERIKAKTDDFITGSRKIHKEYSKKHGELIESELGIKNNTFNKWRALKPHQQFQTGLAIFSILAVAVIAAFSIRQSRKSAALQKESREALEKARNNEAEPARAAPPEKDKTEEKSPPIAVGEKTKALLSAREAAELSAEAPATGLA